MSHFKRFELTALLPEHSALLLDTEQDVLSLLNEEGGQISEQQLVSLSGMAVIEALLNK